MDFFSMLFQKADKPSYPWDNTLFALRSLDVMRYEGFLRPSFSTIKIPAMFPSLADYIYAMETFVEKESHNQLIPIQLFNTPTTIVHLQDLFYDKNGYALPVIETFTKFQNTGESFYSSLSIGGHEVSSRNKDLASRFIQHIAIFIAFIQESEYLLN